MTRFKRYALLTLWVLLPAVLLYASYVCMGGYPDEWDQLWPGMTVQEAVELLGEPDQRNFKSGMLWCRFHLLGRHELRLYPDDQGRIHEVEVVVVFLKQGANIHVSGKSCMVCD